MRLLSVFAVLASPALLPAQQVDDPRPRATAIIDSIASTYPGIAVAVAQGDRLVWSHSRGWANITDSVPATADTRFNVYSVAKMLTGVAAARAAMLGLLDLDASIGALIPGLPSAYSSITPRHLVGHLGGIPHYQSDEDWRRFGDTSCQYPDQALNHFVGRPLTSAPGAARTYSTYGYILLSAVLDAAAGDRDYAEFMSDEVFAPSGMHDTQLDHPESAGKAVPYRRDGERWVAIEGLDASCKFGGGGFVSSASDLARFGQAIYSNSVLDSAYVELATTAFELQDGASTYYAFGMDTNEFEDRGRSIKWIRHSGGSPGGRSFVVVLPGERVAVGIAANADGPSLRVVASTLAYLFAGVTPGGRSMR